MPAVLRWCRAHPDALLTAAALLVMTSTVGADRGTWQAPSNGALALLLLAWLPLVMRTWWPLPVLAVVVTVDTLRIATAADGHSGLVPTATMLALYTASARQRPRLSWALGAATALVQFTVAAVSHWHGSDLLYLNWALVATAIGQIVRERRQGIIAAEQRAEAAERSKQAEAERQVTAERMRIAHELHDVLAHHIALVNAQAGVAQYLLRTDPAAADEALAGIATNSRAALDDLRAALGLLRSESGVTAGDGTRSPTPTAEQLGSLLEGFRAAGMRLEVDTHGAPRPLPGPADLALYRVVQEALTNASKHAAGSRVRLDITWSDEQVELTVANGAPTTAAPAASRTLTGQGTGHGLLGMRERAVTAGGTFVSGHSAEGGYVVTATLPVARDLSLVQQADGPGTS